MTPSIREMTATALFDQKLGLKAQTDPWSIVFNKKYVYHKHNCIIRAGKHPNTSISSGKQPKRVESQANSQKD